VLNKAMNEEMNKAMNEEMNKVRSLRRGSRALFTSIITWEHDPSLL
jgi:hypothetical protein